MNSSHRPEANTEPRPRQRPSVDGPGQQPGRRACEEEGGVPIRVPLLIAGDLAQAADHGQLGCAYRHQAAIGLFRRVGRQHAVLDQGFQQSLKPNTIVQIHRIVSRALKVAWNRGKVARNVASMVDAPIGEDIDIEPLTQEQARQVLAAAASRRNGARWSVALAVGIRQSEAIGLRWQYVDLDAGTIEVGWQLKRARYRHGCQDPAICAASRHRVKCPQHCRRRRW